MKNLIIAPFIVLFITGFAMDIVNTAEDVSQKVVVFAEDMDKATECAINGELISECNPELLNYDFKADLKNYEDLNEKYLSELSGIFDNATIIEKKDKIYIVVEK